MMIIINIRFVDDPFNRFEMTAHLNNNRSLQFCLIITVICELSLKLVHKFNMCAIFLLSKNLNFLIETFQNSSIFST